MPSVVTRAVRAPLRSMIALVASVVPWMTMDMSLGLQARARQDCGHALLDALLRRRGRGENLGGGEPPRVLQRHVGEGAADVDGYAGTLHQVLALLSYVRTSPTTRTRTRSEFPGR